jgi:hypothetical protein
MKPILFSLMALMLLGCLDKKNTAVDPLVEKQLFLELQLQAEVQLVGKWKVRKKTSGSRSNSTQSKSFLANCSIENFEMFGNQNFIIKTVDDNGNFNFVTGQYYSYFESVVIQGEIPRIYLFAADYDLKDTVDFEAALGSIENLAFTSDGIEFDYIPGNSDLCLNAPYTYEAAKEEKLDVDGLGEQATNLFLDWNLKNLMVTVNGSELSNFQCEIIAQSFENCFDENCAIPSYISLSITEYGSYYWKYRDVNNSVVSIEDAFWKFDERDPTAQTFLIKYDALKPWDLGNIIKIIRLDSATMELLETRDSLEYRYLFTINDVENCTF